MFDNKYIESDEYEYDAVVHCMRCHTVVLSRSYMDMPKKNSPNETVSVLCKKKHPFYTLSPVVYEVNGKEVKGHLVLCARCAKEDILEEEKEKINVQLTEAHQGSQAWHGYPEDSYSIKFLRKEA